LEIQKGQSLVIRGATSSFGQAALKMAVNAGARVIATTRSRERFPMLAKLGAERCEIERRGEPEEIAQLMAFLVSPGAHWMTGSTLRMDGGEVQSI
jgi:NAD(P)-dependent dehydrogenase (short-subunit alcohol dehydrogenase family)